MENLYGSACGFQTCRSRFNAWPTDTRDPNRGKLVSMGDDLKSPPNPPAAGLGDWAVFEEDPRSVRADGLVALGEIDKDEGNYSAALHNYNAARVIFEELGDRRIGDFKDFGNRRFRGDARIRKLLKTEVGNVRDRRSA